MIGGKSAARAAGMDNTAAMPAIAKTRILNMTFVPFPRQATNRRGRAWMNQRDKKWQTFVK
jgi:hypothetical protein